MTTTQEKIDNMKRELQALETQLKTEASVPSEKTEMIDITLSLPAYDWVLVRQFMDSRRSWYSCAERRGITTDPFSTANNVIYSELDKRGISPYRVGIINAIKSEHIQGEKD